MARDKMYSERFELCLTPKQKAKLLKISKNEGMTMNEIIRDLINSYCEV